MDAWMWMMLALLFVAAEAQLAGTFVCVFFALGAGTVGGARAAGWLPDFWQQSVAFGGVSAASLWAFRRRLRRRRGSNAGADIDSLVGAEAELIEDLAPGAIGQVELRGVPWRAQSLADVPLSAGGRCWVQGLDGLTLQVVGLRGGRPDGGPAADDGGRR